MFVLCAVITRTRADFVCSMHMLRGSMRCLACMLNGIAAVAGDHNVVLYTDASALEVVTSLLCFNINADVLH
jgi:hypothetical protein